MSLKCLAGRCVSTCENEWFWNLIAVSKLERAEKRKTRLWQIDEKSGILCEIQEQRLKEQALKKKLPKNWLTDEYLTRMVVNLNLPYKQKKKRHGYEEKWLKSVLIVYDEADPAHAKPQATDKK